MTYHEFGIEGYQRVKTYEYEGVRDALIGTVAVEPPFQVGEGFSKAVLGKDQNGIRLEHVITTDEGTAFMVEAALYDDETHHEMITRAGNRIVKLANNPYLASEMSVDNPFPRPTVYS